MWAAFFVRGDGAGQLLVLRGDEKGAGMSKATEPGSRTLWLL